MKKHKKSFSEDGFDRDSKRIEKSKKKKAKLKPTKDKFSKYPIYKYYEEE